MMLGRRKLKIQRLETMSERGAKYAKRKPGILKKANELSILCDVDVALLFFSPSTDKPTLFVGQDKSLYDVLERLSKVPFSERLDRRAYTMEVLRKCYANTESEFVPMEPWQDPETENLKLLGEQLKELKRRYFERSKILRDWKDPNNVDDINKIKIMENHLTLYLQTIRNMKHNQQAIEQQQIGQRSLETNDGLGNGNMNLGFSFQNPLTMEQPQMGGIATQMNEGLGYRNMNLGQNPFAILELQEMGEIAMQGNDGLGYGNMNLGQNQLAMEEQQWGDIAIQGNEGMGYGSMNLGQNQLAMELQQMGIDIRGNEDLGYGNMNLGQNQFAMEQLEMGGTSLQGNEGLGFENMNLGF